MPEISRRNFVRAGAAGTVAVAIGAGSTVRMTQPARAVPPALVYGGIAAGAAVTGWVIRGGYEALTADSAPSSDLSTDVFKETAYPIVSSRKSTNQSTFVDNLNILDGAEHAAYAEGKIAAIKAINNEEAKADVEAAATDAVVQYHTTIRENLLQSWNEACEELRSLVEAVRDHSDFTEGSFISTSYDPDYGYGIEEIQIVTSTETLPDGTDIEVETIDLIDDLTQLKYNPEEIKHKEHSSSEWMPGPGVELNLSPSNVYYLDSDEWTNITDQMDTLFNDVEDNIILWVDSIYDDVQAGEIDEAELLSPQEKAEMVADEEDYNLAVADLMALNMAVETEREAEIYFPDLDSTVYGTLISTGEVTLSVGDTINPDSHSEDFYLYYDESQGHGQWSDYDENAGVDGGVVTYTNEPFENVEYHIDTTDEETAVVEYSDFEYNSTDDEWTVDVSDQLDNSITDVAQISYYSTVQESSYDTVKLTREFEIRGFTDSDGEDYSSATFEQPDEPHDDTNYMTQEEFEQWRESINDTLDQIDESAASGGGGLPNLSNITPKHAAIAAGGAIGLGWLAGLLGG